VTIFFFFFGLIRNVKQYPRKLHLKYQTILVSLKGVSETSIALDTLDFQKKWWFHDAPVLEMKYKRYIIKPVQ